MCRLQTRDKLYKENRKNIQKEPTTLLATPTGNYAPQRNSFRANRHKEEIYHHLFTKPNVCLYFHSRSHMFMFVSMWFFVGAVFGLGAQFCFMFNSDSALDIVYICTNTTITRRITLTNIIPTSGWQMRRNKSP